MPTLTNTKLELGVRKEDDLRNGTCQRRHTRVKYTSQKESHQWKGQEDEEEEEPLNEKEEASCLDVLRLY